MQQNYKRLGDYIRLVNVRNGDDSIKELLGINIDKFFMPSVANVVGTDLSKYKVVSKNQFACNRMHVGRDYRIPIAKSGSAAKFIVSPAYDVFEVIDEDELLPDYLMLWFKRKEFDRNAWFYTDADVRGGLSWTAFSNIQFPLISIAKQKEIIEEYEAVEERIRLNNILCEKLEETAQTLYRHWFEDFEFPYSRHCEERGTSDEAISLNGLPKVAESSAVYKLNNSPSESVGYKSSGGEMVYSEELGKEIPKGWRVGTLGEIAKIVMGQSPVGDSFNQEGVGDIFYQGRTEFGFRFPTIKTYTSESKRRAKKGEILMTVRAPVGDLNIANNDCSIGRGIASLSSKKGKNSFLFYLLQSVKKQFDISNGEGTIFGSITKDDLHGIIVLIPEQNIINDFNDKLEFVDIKIETVSLQNQKLEELKSLLLGKMAVDN